MCISQGLATKTETILGILNRKGFFLNFILFLYSRFLLVIYFIHIGVHMSIPIFQFIPPHPLAPGNHKVIFYICNSISVITLKKKAIMYFS